MAMKDMFLKAMRIAVATFALKVVSVDANWFPWGKGQQNEAVSLNELQSFWVDAMDVISDLENYDKLWIKPHSCVWSECAVDDTDDGYMGDNRDGDEQWYQYRTQGFCANAAYSLYGQKKGDGLFSFSGCTRKHFINSFFTYGGADNLLKSVGESPVVYAYDGAEDDDGNNDDSYSSSANAECYEIDYESSGNDDGNIDEEGDDNANSNSGSNDYDGFTGTLGCDADGKYVIAAFQSYSCDGNYFSGVVDDFEDYNKQHGAIGCHKIYENKGEVSTENVIALLSNSWSCDLRLYPNGCPDPYGTKKKFDFAMRTVAHGGNPQRAYRNMMLKTPIHVITWTFLVLTIVIFVVTYCIKNESRAIKSKGGRNLVGYSRCLAEDITIQSRKIGEWITLKWSTFVKKMTTSSKKSSKKRKKKSSARKKRSVEQDDDTNHSSEMYVHVNDDGVKS